MQPITIKELTTARYDYRLFLNELLQTTPFSFFVNIFTINLESANLDEKEEIRILYNSISILFKKDLTPIDLA